MLGLKSKKKQSKEQETYETRREAFRTAKRDNEIPVSSQPIEVIKPNTEEWREAGLDDRNKRLYIYELEDSLSESGREIHIREDYGVTYPENEGNQLDHFNAGEPPRLKKHYYYKRK